MDIIEVVPRLWLLRFAVGQAYLWRAGDRLTLIDTGPPSDSATAAIVSALRELGIAADDIDQIVLTHWHEDHTGGAAALGERCGARGRRRRAISSLRRAADLDVEVACFGHGDPVVGDAAGVLRVVAARAMP